MVNVYILVVEDSKLIYTKWKEKGKIKLTLFLSLLRSLTYAKFEIGCGYFMKAINFSHI